MENINNEIENETITHNIKFNNGLNFNITISKVLGTLTQSSGTSYRVGNNFTIMNARCNNLELLEKRASEWLKTSASANNQIILDDLEKSYTLNNEQINVIEKVVIKDNKNRYYKFVYYNQSMLIFGYFNKDLSSVIDNIIISIKSKEEQLNVENNSFEKSVQKDVESTNTITELRNNDEITINMFGKEKTVVVFSTGDNQFDESGNYKTEDFKLNQDELNVLNWFINNIKIEDYKNEIMEYCNNEYSSWMYSDGTKEDPIGIDDVENEINITCIAINVTKHWQANDGSLYPEISFYGNCKCDEEHGICIGFRDKKFIGIESQSWTL